MFCQQSLFKLSVCLVLLSLAITPALFSPLINRASARYVPQEKESDHSAIEIERKPQHVFAPHWTTQDGFSTTIYIRNVHISQPTIARTSLILDHRTIMLPDTFVDSLQTVALDVKKALVESGENSDQSGGAVIDFEAESAGAINAYAQVLDTTRSLSFSFPFMQDGTPASGPLDAVAWYYNQNTNASIALQNTTDTETTVTLTIFVSGRTISLGDRHLNPHETKTINLPSPEGPANVSGPRSAGVRVEYEGKPGAVIAQGWVADESIGFSSPFAFHPTSNCNCADVTQHTYGAGIMFGKGGMSVPNAALSADMIFSPNLALRNRSDKPLTINPLFSYQADDKVKRVKLPAFSLIAQDSTVVNLREFQERGIIPSFVEMGNIDLRYTGDAGALVAELASVDQNGSFVSPVPLVCGGSPASHMSFWRTDGDWHSSVTIENIASQATDVEVTISYPGGTYVLEQKIGAGKAAMISINELQQSQQPDREGRRIPLNVTLGGVNIWSPDAKGGLVVNAMLMNPVTRTCGSCTQPGYALSWAVSDKEANASTPLYYGFDPRQVNQGFNIKLNVHWSQGSQGPTDPTSSTSSSPNVASVSNTFGNTLNVGTTNITANGRLFTNASCNQTYDVSSTASLTVIKVSIKMDGSVITTPKNVIVGQKISLTVEVLPTSVTSTNKKWTIPGVRVANYVVTYMDGTPATSATVTALGANPSGSAVDFYWVDGADGRQVQISLKVNGVSFTAVATFNVKRPTATFASTSVSEVTVDSSCSGLKLRYGCNTGSHGVTFSVTDFVLPTGFQGATQLVQRLNSTTRTKLKTGGSQLTLSGTGVLDTAYPYPVEWDAPRQPFDVDDIQITVNDSFTIYLLFKPLLSDSIWVPLRKISWSWSGDGLFSGTLNSGSHSPSQTSVDATDHPLWSGNVTSLTYH